MKSKRITGFIKNEPVLVISIVLALLSIIIFRLSFKFCLESIDFSTIAILFSLMIVIKAFQSQNYLDFIATGFLRFCKTERSLYFLLTYLIFFGSMLVTNDVALLTFVPVSLLIFSRAGLLSFKLIVLETLAANLGSCITPMGNPQNLYLFSYYNFSAADFFLLTSKIALPSMVILALMILFITRKKKGDEKMMLEESAGADVLTTPTASEGRQGKIGQGGQPSNNLKVIFDFRTIFYAADFIICLLTVFHVLDYRIMLGVTVAGMLLCNFRLFKKVDYSLLLTFAALFIFTKSLSTVTEFKEYLISMLSTPLKTYLTGIISSQFISNVPAALLLSGFTQNGAMLLLGVNVGGLGTLIASMASVISFKLYRNSSEAQTPAGKKYFGVFTLYNFVLLILLGVIVYFI